MDARVGMGASAVRGEATGDDMLARPPRNLRGGAGCQGRKMGMAAKS